MTEFSDFGLAGPITRALADEAHKTPTPIQASAIPPLMAGRDLLGIAQTGTGKTAAFALPILHHLANNPRETRRGDCRILVIAPTRELAAQVEDRFKAYGRHMRLRTALVIGGASIGKQKTMLRNGVDVLVATPGRLVDIMEQGAANLDHIEVFVLDEVDQMLDLGFIHTIRDIAAKLPAGRQNVFFSATMPPAISKLAGSLLRDPVRAEIEAKQKLKIDQGVVHLQAGAKPGALLNVIGREEFSRGLVFTRTKHGADKVVRTLNAAGSGAFAIHGNRSQSQREKALDAFRKGKVRILVATDIAARGLDIPGVSHVVNYDLPNIPETYVHRIGRTARAGAAGIAISFCAGDERAYLRSIEKLTQQKIAVMTVEGAVAPVQAPANDSWRPERVNDQKRTPKKPHRKGKSPHAGKPRSAGDNEKKDNHGEGRTARVRRRSNRGAPGRKLSGATG